jgi:DNA-directed RNA polymerase subunit M/transcription elongation factor TFIIS
MYNQQIIEKLEDNSKECPGCEEVLDIKKFQSASHSVCRKCSPKPKKISQKEYEYKVDRDYFRLNKKNPYEKITQQAIKYRIKTGLPLPEVIKHNKVGRIHVLVVRHDF